MMNQLDVSHTGKINYSEFLLAAFDRRELMRKENLWAAFKYFDIENLGYITPDHLKRALIKAGMEITDEEA